MRVLRVFIEDSRTGEMLKRCPKCRQYKSFSEYHKLKSSPHGVRSACKDCTLEKMRKYKDENDHFWKFYHSHTQLNGGCLEWTGSNNGHGYPLYSALWQGKRTRPVTRIVYKLSCGELEDGMFIIQTCRNKRCVRQSHLKKITKDEAYAMAWNASSHRRKHRIRPIGSKNHRAKLSEEKVMVIKSMYADGTKQTEIAGLFGVALSTINGIVRGKRWTHVPWKIEAELRKQEQMQQMQQQQANAAQQGQQDTQPMPMQNGKAAANP